MPLCTRCGLSEYESDIEPIGHGQCAACAALSERPPREPPATCDRCGASGATCDIIDLGEMTICEDCFTSPDFENTGGYHGL